MWAGSVAELTKTALGYAQGALDASLSVVFGPRCLACGEEDVSAPFCRACRDPRPIGPMVCDRCGVGTPTAISACGRCLARTTSSGLERIRSYLWLDDGVLALLHHVKYGGRRRALSVYRGIVDTSTAAGIPDGCAVIPVPMHDEKLVQRGFNPAEEIARWFARRQGSVMDVSSLFKCRSSAPQARLSRVERRKNLKGAFVWGSLRPVPSRVVVVDDIFTTGATLEACARALRAAGVREVYGLTLFRTPHLSAD